MTLFTEPISAGSRPELEKLVAELAYPAVLLGPDCKILLKNSFCISRIIPLRVGSCIKNHLSPADFRRLTRLKTGETIRVSLELPSLYGAFVYKGEDCFLVGLRSLSAALQNRVSELMRLNSELTESLLCQLGVVSSQPRESGVAELIKNKSNRIIRAQNHISEFLRIINGVKNEKARLCDLSVILDSIINSVRESLRPLGITITYDALPAEESLIATVCEPDFNMILCLILNACIRISAEGKIAATVKRISGRAYVSVMTDCVLPPERVRGLCAPDLDETSFASPDGWLYFELLLTGKLCEYYMWDFKASAPGSDYSRVQLALSIPLEPGVPAFILRSPEASQKERAEIIALEFSNLLDI